MKEYKLIWSGAFSEVMEQLPKGLECLYGEKELDNYIACDNCNAYLYATESGSHYAIDTLSYRIAEFRKRDLISELIAALNVNYEEAARITKEINATGDKELIKQAEHLNSVV